MRPVDKILPTKYKNHSALINGVIAALVIGGMLGRKMDWSDDQDKALSAYIKKYKNQKINRNDWARKENTD